MGSRAQRFAGLDLLGSAVVILARDGKVTFLNTAAAQAFDSSRSLVGQPFRSLFTNPAVIDHLLALCDREDFSEQGQDVQLERVSREALVFHCLAVAIDASDGGGLLLEFHATGERQRLDREERLLDSARANRELVRNLAHEIKNPLGGVRGAAQLLELELSTPALREYTQVIIKEADRLRALVDRLLAPDSRPRSFESVGIHEVCERVRSILLAEYPSGLLIVRDYDPSLPELHGDRGQLIQALLNLSRNAAEALGGRGRIQLRTRIARQVVIDRTRHKLALELHVVDNGPGIPEALRDRVFYPLVSGREGGSGLGLPLAQTYIERHGGTIECESRPGLTDFRILLPLP
jgi:two-component system nitrogen regulation sensor histidine kinase GlnL